MEILERAPVEDSIERAMQALQESCDFELAPNGGMLDLGDTRRYTEMAMSDAQKTQLSALVQHVPNALAAGVLSQSYVVKFPKGLPHTLTALKNGGFGSMILENGRFVGTASLYSAAAQAAMMSAFSAMSLASGQYFLAKIQGEMRMMRMKLDEILEFLYGDKKAELMAEMSFIHYAYQHYRSIMGHEQQRTATLASLQNARKIAMKDIEFYISDLDSTASRKPKDYAELTERIQKAFQIRESLSLAEQLYAMSSIMEVYYAQNLDADYVKGLESDMLAYIDKCDKRVLGSFSALKGQVVSYKPKAMEKVDKRENETRISAVVESVGSKAESVIAKTVSAALQFAQEPATFYIARDGGVFLKAA